MFAVLCCAVYACTTRWRYSYLWLPYQGW